MRPQIQSIADGLLDAIGSRGEADVVADYAFPLPMEVVRLLFAVDADSWAANVTARFDPAAAGAAGAGPLGPMGALAEWFVGVVEERRRAPGDDMFSAMLAPDESGDALSTEELVANAVLLVTAGFETTMSLITLAVHALLTHPEQKARLVADPALARNAVEETLRYDPAALSTTRCTPGDLEIEGVTVPAGANILFSVVAGNRDPRRYDAPAAFDITRDDIRPLTFGAGVARVPRRRAGAPRGRDRDRLAVRPLPRPRARAPGPRVADREPHRPPPRRPAGHDRLTAHSHRGF